VRLLRRRFDRGGAAEAQVRPSALGFLTVAMLACAVLAVPARAWAVASSETLGTASGTSAKSAGPPEATRNTKVTLLKALTAAPDLIVFGSSRAMRVNPADYTAWTGRTAFNAAVSSGTIADAYCFAHYVRSLFPGTTQRYLWLIDVEEFRHDRVHRSVYAQPELAQFIPSGFPSPYTGTASASTTTPTPTPTPTPTYGPVDVFDANGWLVWNRYDYYRTRSRTLAKGLAYSRWKAAQVYPKGYGSMKGVPKWFCTQAISLMNQWGATPVIVLTPYHPNLYRFISARNYLKRHAEVIAYFTWLQNHGLKFVLLDFTDIKSWGGWASGFYDGTHMRASLTKMLFLQALGKSGGVL